MTITHSLTDFWNLFASESKTQTIDEFESISQYPSQLGRGYLHDMELGTGIWLQIMDEVLRDDLVVKLPVREHPIESLFQISGGSSVNDADIKAGQHQLFGSGIAAADTGQNAGLERRLEVNIHMEPDVLKNFFADPSGELPAELQFLIKDNDWQTVFAPTAITPVMQITLQQILHCPYEGITKRIYLQGKVFELLALQLEPFLKKNKPKNDRDRLKPKDIDRIHYAKEILLARLENPPSLIELARAVGLNDYKLKIGFHQVFGTTVFGYLHNYRLERSRQLLEVGDLTVTEVTRAIGFANRSYFATAFKRKFGVNPNDYRRQQRGQLA